MSIESLVIVLLALVIGTIGKAVTGFGLPLIAIPVMAAFIDVETAVVVMVFPSTLSNVWLLWEFRASARRIEGLWAAIVGGFIGVIIGTWLLKTLDPAMLDLVLAVWIGVYLLTQMRRRPLALAASQSRVLLPFAVWFGGICQGATGAAGPVVVTFLHATRLERGVLVFGISAIFLSFGVTQVVAMLWYGLMTEARVVQGLVAMIPVVAVMPFGLRLGQVVDARTFNVCVIVLLAATGLKLAWDGIASFV